MLYGSERMISWSLKAPTLSGNSTPMKEMKWPWFRPEWQKTFCSLFCTIVHYSHNHVMCTCMCLPLICSKVCRDDFYWEGIRVKCENESRVPKPWLSHYCVLSVCINETKHPNCAVFILYYLCEAMIPLYWQCVQYRARSVFINCCRDMRARAIYRNIIQTMYMHLVQCNNSQCLNVSHEGM